MNTRNECINIVRKVLSSNDHDISKISFVEGEQLDYLSSVDIDTGVIKFPILQEVFLILYELDEGKRILYLFLAISLLDNNEYELCEEVLEILENEGLPTCHDSDALYRSLLVKQLFIIFHECGHFFNESDEEWNKKLCERNSRISQNFIFQPLDESVVKKIAYEEHKWCPEAPISFMESEIRKQCSEEGMRNSISNFFSKRYFVEEFNADVFALEALETFFKEDSEFEITDKTGKSILEGASSIYAILFLKNDLILCSDEDGDEEEQYLNIVSPLSKLRFGLLGGMIKELTNESVMDFLDVLYNYAYKAFLFEKSEEEADILSDYMEYSFDSNYEQTNLVERNRLSRRIMAYADSIMGLYDK